MGCRQTTWGQSPHRGAHGAARGGQVKRRGRKGPDGDARAGRREWLEGRSVPVFEAEDAIELGGASRRHLQPISDLGPGLVIGLLV